MEVVINFSDYNYKIFYAQGNHKEKKSYNQYTKDKEKRSKAIHFQKLSNNKKSKRGRWEQKMQTNKTMTKQCYYCGGLVPNCTGFFFFSNCTILEVCLYYVFYN